MRRPVADTSSPHAHSHARTLQGGRSEPRSSVGARLSTVSTSVSSDSGRVVGGRASAQSQSQGPSPGRPSTRGGSRASADRAAAAARLAAGTSARPSTRAGRGSRALPPIAGRPSRGSEEASGSGGARTSAGSAVSRRSHGYMPKQKQTFYLGGGNGVKLLQGLLEAKGFERIPSGPAGRASSQFKIKWCERASDFNFAEFKEGKQLIGRNPKIACIGNKLKLRQTMVAYERSCTQKGVPCLKTASFLPMTYELTNARERQSFEQLSAENPAWQWICKPTGLNCGQGIFVVDDVAEFKQKLARDDAERQPGAKVPTRIIQRYIANPMLLKGRKFDIRAYMLIASAKPLLGLYGGRGYCRLTIDEYDGAAAGNKAAHLTNQAVQKKHPRYKEMVEDTTWSIEMMNECVAALAFEKSSPVASLSLSLPICDPHCVRLSVTSSEQRRGHLYVRSGLTTTRPPLQLPERARQGPEGLGVERAPRKD